MFSVAWSHLVHLQESAGQLRQYKCQRLPPYIILHFKRFAKNAFVEEKNPTIVNFPLLGLDFKECMYSITIYLGLDGSSYSFRHNHYRCWCASRRPINALRSDRQRHSWICCWNHKGQRKYSVESPSPNSGRWGRQWKVVHDSRPNRWRNTKGNDISRGNNSSSSILPSFPI